MVSRNQMKLVSIRYFRTDRCITKLNKLAEVGLQVVGEVNLLHAVSQFFGEDVHDEELECFHHYSQNKDYSHHVEI